MFKNKYQGEIKQNTDMHFENRFTSFTLHSMKLVEKIKSVHH